MSGILFMESFEDEVPLGKWDSNTSNTNNASGLHGKGRNVTYPTYVPNFRHTLISPVDTVITGVASKWSAAGTNPGAVIGDIQFRTQDGVTSANATSGISVIQRALKMEIYRGTTLLATSAVVITVDNWHYIEVEAYLHDTNGTVEVWVDGVSAVSFGPGDTKPGSETTITHVCHNFGYSTGTKVLDDIYILDPAGESAPYNAPLGPVRVDMLVPDGDGATSNLTGSDGNQVNNFQQIDEIAYSGTDYNGSATEGDLDTYALPAMATPDTVFGVQANTFRAKSDAGAKFMRTVMRSNSVNYVGSSSALTGTYTTYRDIWKLNPNTSTAWTKTTVDAAEVGAEVRDS